MTPKVPRTTVEAYLECFQIRPSKLLGKTSAEFTFRLLTPIYHRGRAVKDVYVQYLRGGTSIREHKFAYAMRLTCVPYTEPEIFSIHPPNELYCIDAGDVKMLLDLGQVYQLTLIEQSYIRPSLHGTVPLIRLQVDAIDGNGVR